MSDIHKLEIDLDLKDNLLLTVNCKQLDNLHLIFNIWDNGQVADLSNYKCKLKALKSDQVPLIQHTNIIINSNVVTIDADGQLTTTSGTTKVEIQLIDKTTGLKKSSFNLNLRVVASVLEVDRSISKATCDLLQELEYNLDKVENIEFNFDEGKAVNESLKVQNPLASTNYNNLKCENDKAPKLTNNLKIENNKAPFLTDNLKAQNKEADKKIEIIKSLDPSNIVQDVATIKKQVLENTFTKLETDSTLTKLEAVKDGFVHNMLLMGRTLQNFYGNYNCVLALPKASTIYTFKALCKNTSDKEQSIQIKEYTTWSAYSDRVSIAPKSEKIVILRLRHTPEDLSTMKNLYLDVYTEDKSGGDLKAVEPMLLEGDWTGKEIPPYFTGIKSVGELEDNRISILSTGKNILKNNKYTLTSKTDRIAKIPIYKLKPNTSYVVSLKLSNSNYPNSSILSSIICPDNNYDARIGYSVEHNTSIINGNNPRFIFVTPQNFINKNNYLWLYDGNIDFNVEGYHVDLLDIQFEEGTTDTFYEESKEDKTEILIPSPHCGLPDGSADIIDFEKNERIKNVIKGVFNGSDNEYWILGATLTNTITFWTNTSNGSKNTGEKNGICDKFKVVDASNMLDEECIGFGDTANGVVQIRINKSKLPTPDLAGFKAWLKANPVTVYYQLAESIKEKLNIKDTLETFTDGYIQLDNSIVPFASLEYSTNLPSIVSTVVSKQDKIIDRLSTLEDLILTLTTNKIVNK